MTMTRTEKHNLAGERATAAHGGRGYTAAEFLRPAARAAAIAARGHARMTLAECAAAYYGRRPMPTLLLDALIADRARLRRSQRLVGGRRVSGPRELRESPIERDCRATYPGSAYAGRRRAA